MGRVGRVDKLTMRGWSMDANTDGNGVYHASSLAGMLMEVNTVVFEGEEIPPELFKSPYIMHPNFVRIKRVVAPHVKAIGDSAFVGTVVSEFELPYGLKTIGRAAFIDNIRDPDLEEGARRNIKIPSTVTYIGPAAFKPQQVDIVSLRGRNWEFAVPPDISSTEGYTQKIAGRGPEDLWERKYNENFPGAFNPIGRWLNSAEAIERRYALLTPEEKYFWNLFKRRAMMCGPEKKPSGVWFHR